MEANMSTQNEKAPYFNPIDYLERNEKVGRPIVVALLLLSLGIATFHMQNANYENYCKEPQARCDLNKNISITQTFSNIFTTLKNGPK